MRHMTHIIWVRVIWGVKHTSVSCILWVMCYYKEYESCDRTLRFIYPRLQMNESWYTCERVMSHMWRTHVTHMKESRTHMSRRIWVMSQGISVMSHSTYQWVTPHVCMSQSIISHGIWVISHSIYEWVTSHISMSHATHMNESRHTYEWVRVLHHT